MADATNCTGQFTQDNEGHRTQMQLQCFCSCCISFMPQKYISEFRAGALFWKRKSYQCYLALILVN